MKLKFILPVLVLALWSCTSSQDKAEDSVTTIDYELLNLQLDSIFIFEQTPIRRRDSLIRIYGAESAEAEAYQKIYRKNHAINEVKVRNLLDKYGWPNGDSIGEQGNRVICNVLQHSDSSVRIAYLPMMKTAVMDGNLEPQWLVRAEDRIATDQGRLQIYGGQMKYYPETKSFNVWPVYDPENINKRRAEIGLIPIEEHLMNRFQFEWNLEEQIERSHEFEANRLKQN